MEVKRGRPVKSVTPRTWEREIAELMEEFCMKPAQIKEVISATRKEIKETDTYDQKYNRAWRKFWRMYNAA